MSVFMKPQPPPKPHSLTNSMHRRNGVVRSTKVQDKTMEELVLDDLYYDIVRNLPADDIAMLMDEQRLLTTGQRDHYRMMKANHLPDVEKSEYLIDCLRKGEPGFLQRLCTILKMLPPSSYIADKIQDKVQEVSTNPLVLKPQRPESVSKIKSDMRWKAEYRKLEMKTRMQIQAKDREIKRLRKVIQHLQKENSNHLEHAFSEMKSQVENVLKWIDLKSKAALTPHSSSLLRIALSRDGKYRDLYSSHESQLSSSDVSSNQSTLERCHHHRKESLESYQPYSTCPPSSCDSSQVATPTTPTRARNCAEGDSDLLPIHLLMKNASSTPSVQSDMSYITRLLKRESETMLYQELQPDSCDNDLSMSKVNTPTETLSLARHDAISDRQSTLATTFVRARERSMSAPFVATETLSSTTLTDNNDSTLPTTAPALDELNTPSTLKSNTTSPKSSIQENPEQQKWFVYGLKDIPQQESEPMADLIAVFRKIQGREFITQSSD